MTFGLATAGLRLTLNGVEVSVEVPISSIGEASNTSHPYALLCETNLIACCRSPNPVAGEWFFPNNSMVGINSGGGGMYRNRGDSIVRLNRRPGVTGPLGMYCCQVPTTTDPNARICITLSECNVCYIHNYYAIAIQISL